MYDNGSYTAVLALMLTSIIGLALYISAVCWLSVVAGGDGNFRLALPYRYTYTGV